MDDILGVIITYNPDIALLEENITAIVEKITKLVVCDNASANYKEIEELINKFKCVELIANSCNLGLPINYNMAAKKAMQQGYEWLLILDQDTVLPDSYIDTARHYMQIKDIAIICPRYQDMNLENMEKSQAEIFSEDYSYIEQCISSGSLCKVKLLLELGGFDERMFIDYVDYDYCRTVREYGGRILQLNNCVMEHRIGQSEKRHFLGRTPTIYNHSPMRKYYFFRNKIYYARKHGITIWKNKQFYIQYCKNFVLLLFEKENKIQKIKAALKGICDGVKMEIPNRRYK